jgi:hypothetical protein
MEMEGALDQDLLRCFLEQSCQRATSNSISQMVASALGFFVEDVIARTGQHATEVTSNDVVNVIKSMPEYQFAREAITDHRAE